MYLENLVFDAVEPQRLGRFWEAVVGGEQLTDEPAGYETRLPVDGGPVLDLCFQRVAEPATAPARLRLDLSGGASPRDEVDRLLGLGARPLDVGQGDPASALLADPEGNPFSVGEDRPAYAGTGTGPLVSVRLDSADPDRDARFWSWLTGWTAADSRSARSLRHRSLRGPVLELGPETAPKSPVKNRVHLDVRLEPGEDPDGVTAAVLERGGAALHHPEWGELPWRSYTDPSGNEFCVLPAPR